MSDLTSSFMLRTDDSDSTAEAKEPVKRKLLGHSVEWIKMPYEINQHENIISADSSVFSTGKSRPGDNTYRRNAHLYSSIMGPVTRRSTVGTPFSKAAINDSA